jgi:hypothetical protein
MNFSKLLIGISLLLLFASCKKGYIFSKSDLIGTWTQVAPFPPNDSTIHIFIFTHDSAFATSPYITKGAYTLTNDYTIAIDCTITEGPLCNGLGSSNYNISGSTNSLIFYDFYSRGGLSGSIQTFNLYLNKTQ